MDCGTEVEARRAAEAARRIAEDPEHRMRSTAARGVAGARANRMARGIRRGGIAVVAPTVGEAVALLDATQQRRTGPEGQNLAPLGLSQRRKQTRGRPRMTGSTTCLARLQRSSLAPCGHGDRDVRANAGRTAVNVLPSSSPRHMRMVGSTPGQPNTEGIRGSAGWPRSDLPPLVGGCRNKSSTELVAMVTGSIECV